MKCLKLLILVFESINLMLSRNISIYTLSILILIMCAQTPVLKYSQIH